MLADRAFRPDAAALDRARHDVHRADAGPAAVAHRRLLADAAGQSRRRRWPLGRGILGAVDSAPRHQLQLRSRWTEPADGGAHRPARPHGSGLLVEGNRAQRRLLPPEPDVESGRRHRRVPRHRPVPVFLLLGNDAGADVLPHRALGSQHSRRQEPRVLGDQVLHLHAGLRPDHAGVDPESGVRALPRNRHADLRLRRAAQHTDGCGHRVLADARLLHRLRGQAAGGAVPGCQTRIRRPPPPVRSISPACC